MNCPKCNSEMELTSAVGEYSHEHIHSTFNPHMETTELKFIGFKLIQCPKCKYVEIKPWAEPSR